VQLQFKMIVDRLTESIWFRKGLMGSVWQAFTQVLDGRALIQVIVGVERLDEVSQVATTAVVGKS